MELKKEKTKTRPQKEDGFNRGTTSIDLANGEVHSAIERSDACSIRRDNGRHSRSNLLSASRRLIDSSGTILLRDADDPALNFPDLLGGNHEGSVFLHSLIHSSLRK